MNETICICLLFSRNFSATVQSQQYHDREKMYAELAIPLAVDKVFTYKVPDELQPMVKCGVRAVVPFGNRLVVGFIVDIKSSTTLSTVKNIRDVLDPEPFITDELLSLAKWMADYYFVPLGEVLRAMVIQGSARPGRQMVKLLEENWQVLPTVGSLLKKQEEVLQILQTGKSTSISQIQKKIKSKKIHSILNDLILRKIISVQDEIPGRFIKPKTEVVINACAIDRADWQKWLYELGELATSKRYEKQVALIQSLIRTDSSITEFSYPEALRGSGVSFATLQTLIRKRIFRQGRREITRTPDIEPDELSIQTRTITLNSYQRVALDSIANTIRSGKYRAFLLHGITGSGKTQVYIETIKEAIAMGKTAIVLVPEISLTPQTVRRFKAHFDKQVIVMHSRMSAGERADAWRLARDAKCSVVIGPRSAIFAPLKNIGLIVVDEEHEASYKQFDQTPRYHARDVAVMRAMHSGAVVVLGSATPSVESYSNATQGKYTLLELPERIDNAQLPEVQIIDMAKERMAKLEIHRRVRQAEFKADRVKAKLQKRKFEFGSISDLLREKIENRLGKKEGIILLQNRRGFSPFVECPECGHVEMCDHCNISLTYHAPKDHLRCHYCGAVKPVPIFCPQCQSLDIQHRGFGTQRVEEEIQKLFPTAKLLRMDLDTTTAKGAHDAILKKFGEGEADILLGTQMVAKGLDFSRVTLVGVISADTQMMLPDFRSAERTFQLLTQVAGRAGRSTLAGEVVIQTYQADHPVLQHVRVHDFRGFYDEELSWRKELRYPPFSRLILVEFKGSNEQIVANHALTFAGFLKKRTALFEVLGPAAAAITKIKNMYRWHVVIKSLKVGDPSGRHVHHALSEAVNAYMKTSHAKAKNVKMIIDIDPAGMM
jgi:primosomal protein N' (replication factor Y) (superfamily II helicase)